MTVSIKGLRYEISGERGPKCAFLPDDRVMQMAWYLRGELDEISAVDQDTPALFKILKEVLSMSEEDLEKKLIEWWPEKFGCNPRETEPEGVLRDVYQNKRDD